MAYSNTKFVNLATAASAACFLLILAWVVWAWLLGAAGATATTVQDLMKTHQDWAYEAASTSAAGYFEHLTLGSVELEHSSLTAEHPGPQRVATFYGEAKFESGEDHHFQYFFTSKSEDVGSGHFITGCVFHKEIANEILRSHALNSPLDYEIKNIDLPDTATFAFDCNVKVIATDDEATHEETWHYSFDFNNGPFKASLRKPE